ncbi:MAG: DUF5615 family PIN-like protein [Magnetococcales bacterium]|nr:DUF5615 family PIN-like protein [Magnetococcales bacterium]
MKLLIDMNLSPRWVDVLASAGIQAEHWSTLGARDAFDVAFAMKTGLDKFSGFGSLVQL